MTFKIEPKSFTIKDLSNTVAGKATVKIGNDHFSIWRLPRNGTADVTELLKFISLFCKTFASDKPVYVRINENSTEIIECAKRANYEKTNNTPLCKNGYITYRGPKW